MIYKKYRKKVDEKKKSGKIFHFEVFMHYYGWKVSTVFKNHQKCRISVI